MPPPPPPHFLAPCYATVYIYIYNIISYTPTAKPTRVRACPRQRDLISTPLKKYNPIVPPPPYTHTHTHFFHAHCSILSTLAANRKEYQYGCSGFPLLLSFASPHARRHITVNINVLSASLNKKCPSFLVYKLLLI